MEHSNISTLSGPAPLGLATLHSCNHRKVNSVGRSATHRAGCGMEEWKAINGFLDSYEVSDTGRIRYVGNYNKKNTPRIVKTRLNKQGYTIVSMTSMGQEKTCTVHRLVAEAFIGKRDHPYEVAHNNGIRDDNRVCNLRWALPVENSADRILHGTVPCGSRNGSAKLTPDQVLEILEHVHISAGEFSRRFGVHRSTVSYIRTGRNWACINPKVVYPRRSS